MRRPVGAAACCTQRARPSARRGGTAPHRARHHCSSARRAISGLGSSWPSAVQGTSAPSSAAGAKRLGRRGQRLQQHRRLALVGRDVTHAQQAGRGVEPAAHAGGRRAAQARAPASAPRRRHPGGGRSALRSRATADARAAPPRPCATARARRRRRRAGRSAPDGRGARQAAPSTCSSSPPQAPPSRAQADAVQRQAEQRASHAVLGGDGRDVRVVVLHRMRRQRAAGRELEREAGAEEVRVQVVRHGLRPHVEHRAQVLDHLDQRVAGGGVVQVADMRRQEGLVAARDAHGVLQPGAGGQHAAGRRVAA